VPEERLSTFPFRVGFRPVRIGWCITANNTDQLRQAIRLTTCLWGGRYNPIIPIPDDFADAWVEFFKVDALFPLGDDPAVNAFISAYPYVHWPTFHREIFIESGGPDKSRLATMLDIYHPIRHLYEHHIRNVERPKINGTLFEWQPADPLALILMSTAGDLPLAADSKDYRGMITRNLAGKSVLIQETDPIPRDVDDALTPLRLTTLDLTPHHTSSWGRDWRSPGFYYGDSQTFTDLVLFWNLRACNIDLVFYDPAYAARLNDLRDDFLSRLRSRARDPLGWERHITVWGRRRVESDELRDWGPDIMSASAGGIDLPGDLPSASRGASSVWNGMNLRAPLMHFEDDSVLASVAQEQGGITASFQLPKKPFFDDVGLHSQNVALSVHPIGDISTTEEQTFRSPNLPELNEFYGRNVHFHPHTSRAEVDGIAQIISITTAHSTQRAIGIRELIHQIFKTFGIQAQPSQPGLIASRLIGQMGGVQDCRVFKITGVRQLIDSYNPYQPFTRSAAIQIIGNNDPATGRPRFERFERLFIERRTANRLKPEDAFKYLLAKQVFRVGLQLTCSRCHLDFWRSLDEVATMSTCEYCGQTFNIAGQLRDRDWAYRRSGLFGREDHQEGSIPVVLTLQQLHTTLNFHEMSYSTAMTLTPITATITPCETDLVILCQNHEGRVQLGIGECKSAGEITDDDVAKLKRVADALPAKRLDVFVIFSKLSGFSPAEIKRCHSIQDQYRPRVIMLTSRELEPYFVYEDTEKEYDIPATASSLEDLARVTDKLFLHPVKKAQQ